MVRKAIRTAVKMGGRVVGENITGNTALRVLQNIDETLSYLGVSHYVSMGEFVDAAVRVGFNGNVGIAVYHIMDLLI